MNQRTLVLGASSNPQRYSYKAVKLLSRYKHKLIAFGHQSGEIEGVKIETERKGFENIHTITLYINPKIQKDYYQYILDLKPKRIIFNPGTENQELKEKAILNNIEVVYDCTLVMLNSGIF